MFVSQPSGVLIPRQRGPHDLDLVPKPLQDWYLAVITTGLILGMSLRNKRTLGCHIPSTVMASLVPDLGMRSEGTPSPYNVEALLEFCTVETESKECAVWEIGVM